jgi:hypothetical protein
MGSQLAAIEGSAEQTNKLIVHAGNQADALLTAAEIADNQTKASILIAQANIKSADTLTAALVQYRLVTAEKQLLEQTLSGSIQVLTEVLSLVNPGVFSRTERARRYIRHVATAMSLRDLLTIRGRRHDVPARCCSCQFYAE